MQFLSSTLHFAIYLYWNKKLKSIMTSYSGWFEVCADKHRVTGHFNLPAIRQCVSSYLKGSESVWSWFRYSSMVYVFVLIGVSVSLLALEDKSSLWCTIIPFDLYLYARMMDDQGDQRPMQPVQWCTIDSSWPKKKKITSAFIWQSFPLLITNQIEKISNLKRPLPICALCCPYSFKRNALCGFMFYQKD